MATVRKPSVRKSNEDINPIWASALGAAAGVSRKAAFSEGDVFQAVIEELRRIRLRGSVALFTENHLLEIKVQSLSGELTRTLRRLSGMEVRGYRFDPEKVDAYREALSTGEAIFVSNRATVISQMIPNTLGSLVPRILRLIGRYPVIIAPLILSEKPLGTINVSASWLTEADVPMVSALADHIAIALGHLRARSEMQAALKRERLLNEVAAAISSELDLPLVLETVLGAAAEVTNADAGAIGLLEPDGNEVSFPHLFGLPEELRNKTLPRTTGLIWHLVDSRQPMLIPDYRDSPDADPNWIAAGIRGLLGVPLIAGEDVIGGLGLFTIRRDRAFEEEHVEMALAIANMASVAIKNARLFSDTIQRAKESQALIRTARSISASLDQETVLHLIANEAKKLLQTDASRIHLLDTAEGAVVCVVALGPASEAAMSMRLEPGQGLVGYVMEHDEALIVNDAAHDPRGIVIPETPEDELECLLVAPLSVRQRVMGAMTVRRIGIDRPFSASDLDLLNAFAAQASVTLENAHLFGQIAAQAQRLEVEVSERTRDLAFSEARYRALVETSLAGIFQVDTEGKLTYINQAMVDLGDYQTDELIGRHFLDFIPPKYRQDIADYFQARINRERPAREVYELVLPSRTGQRIPVLLAASLITGDDGKPRGVSGLVLDVSQQKNLEAALQAERDRLDVLLTNIGDAVMVTNAEGVIEYVNPGWERLNGYSAREALGKTPRILQSGHHPTEFYAEMWNTILGGQTWRGDVINCRKDGTFYDAALTITPVSNEDGKVINFVSVSHDISALKEIDRLKSQFVSDVSHELRTPLTNIRLYLDLLERKSDDTDKVAQYLETLSRESERLANLIDDLLSLSRLDADAVPLKPIPVDINELLGSLATDRQTLAAKRGLSLTTEPASKLPNVTGDARLLTQVFTNLLTNAMNYTPQGGSIILRTKRHRDDEGEWVISEVDDTGLGIPNDEIGMIFRRFFRGSASQKTNAPGTGLGLSICEEIVERHGGRILVESQGIPGSGSCFSVWLPVNQIEE